MIKQILRKKELLRLQKIISGLLEKLDLVDLTQKSSMIEEKSLDVESLIANQDVIVTDSLKFGTMYLLSSAKKKMEHILIFHIQILIQEWVLKEWLA